MVFELWCKVFRESWTIGRGTMLVLWMSIATAPLLWQCDTRAALPDVIRIGVVYDQSWSSEEAKLLSQALDRVNLNASDVGEDLPQHKESGGIQAVNAWPRAPHLSLAGVRLEAGDILRSLKKVCGLLEQGVLAVLGSQQPDTALLVRHACARHQVPHVYLHRGEGEEHALPQNTLSLTVTPSAEELGRALCDLVKAQGWKHFTVIYEKPDALVRLRGLLQLHRPGEVPPAVSLRPLDEKTDPRSVLREVAKAGENNIVLDLTTHRLADVLRHAQKVGIVNEYYNFIVTTLDLHTVDLSDFQNSGTNLSGFVLVKKELWENDIAAVRDAYSCSGFHSMFRAQRASRKPIRTYAALTQDALDLVASAVQRLAAERIHARPLSIRCPGQQASRHGPQFQAFVDAVKQTHISGLTGAIHMDTMGRRHNISLQVVRMKRAGLSSVGTWSASAGLTMTQTEKMFREEILSALKNKTFRITTLLNAPYIMYKESSHKLVGNDRFEGFCVDLLREMSRLLGFRYQLQLARDGAYGSRNSRGHWNGMVRELLDMEADLAIGDITITYAREMVVDFSMPFMSLGVGILYRKPPHKPSLLFFLSPLSTDVWVCVVAAYVLVSLLLCCVARMGGARWTSVYVCAERCCCPYQRSPSRGGGGDVVCVGGSAYGSAGLDIIMAGQSGELQPRHRERIFSDEKKRDNVRKNKRQFTLLNSLWFTMSAIMRQGCDSSPRSASTRIMAVAWWLFSFILVSSYTANLASFLTRERLQSPIESAEDLAKQTEILYGCVRSGSTEAFFKDSKQETYERMWNAMKHDLVSSNAEGVERVERGGYAFLMESSSIEYAAQRRCQLTQVGGLLDSKAYGIAMPQGSPYRGVLSSAMLRLQESGTLEMLKDRWWKVADSARRCPDDPVASRSDAASELGLPKVGGVFVVLLAGLGLACVIAFAEFFFKARSSRKRHQSLGATTSGRPVDISDKHIP
ncbi:glutamate receptor ionotropic, kainate 2-like isoform X3 [Rhipicephalus microplus]|uniref:glutamate receptor ionotropic, kainate 2-like isoform X3 n=1 Tax=Rhipicephalus microplus TaxID=6941 RepID=UPI003F6BDEBD